MKNSDLDIKPLVKFVLKEIALNPKYQEPEHPLAQLAKMISGNQPSTREHPAYNDIGQGHKACKELIKKMKLSTKMALGALVRKDSEKFYEEVRFFSTRQEQILSLTAYWANKISATGQGLEPTIHNYMKHLPRHVYQLGDQLQAIFLSMTRKTDWNSDKVLKHPTDKGHKQFNYINAHNQLKELQRMFDEVDNAIDGLFQIGLQQGMKASETPDTKKHK